MPTEYIMPIYNTVVGVIIGLLVSGITSLIRKGKNASKQKDARVDATERGIAILLRKQLREYYAQFEYQQSIPQSEWADIVETHTVYNELGGNSTGDRLFQLLSEKHIQG